MMKNKIASIRQKLLNRAKSESVDFQRMLTRYGIERLLYRLSRSPYRSQFTVKGAVLFTVWLPDTLFHRATKDLDLLGYGDPSHETMKEIFQALCSVEVEDDGLVYDSESVSIDEIKPDDDYNGVRVKLEVSLGKALIPLQIDVGFGDAVSPEAITVNFPSLLDQEEPEVLVYPKESVIAEKFQAMVALGEYNSRMKDFFDIYLLSEQFDFDGDSVKDALTATFERRKTEMPRALPVALEESFAVEKRRLWNAFLRKSQPVKSELTLEQVLEKLRSFLWPVCSAITESSKIGKWNRGGPWSTEDASPSENPQE